MKNMHRDTHFAHLSDFPYLARVVNAEWLLETTKALKELIPDFEGRLTQKIENRYQETSKILEELQTENKKLRRSVEKLQFQLNQKDEKIADMAVKLDSIEQREFINDVQIVGVEESSSEEQDKKKVLKLAKEKMDVKLKKTDIVAIHRLGKKSSKKTKCRDLVVRFKEATTRETFYNNRKKMVTSKLPN